MKKFIQDNLLGISIGINVAFALVNILSTIIDTIVKITLIIYK